MTVLGWKTTFSFANDLEFVLFWYCWFINF